MRTLWHENAELGAVGVSAVAVQLVARLVLGRHIRANAGLGPGGERSAAPRAFIPRGACESPQAWPSARCAPTARLAKMTHGTCILRDAPQLRRGARAAVQYVTLIVRLPH